MRLFPRLAIALFCAASTLAAHAQQSTLALGHGQAVSFAYDAAQGQISTSGLQLNPSKAKANAVTPTTGTIDVTLTIATVTRFPRNTQFRCTVTAIGGILNLNNGTVDGGIETVSGVATAAAGGGLTCSLAIPYSWTLPAGAGAQSGLILAYAVGATNVHDGPIRSSLQLDGIENLPANGATSNFAFDVTL